MNKEEIFAYRDSINLERQLRDDFENSIIDLKKEIKDRTETFKNSISELTTKNSANTDKIKKEGEEILKTIYSILRNKYGLFYQDYAAGEFGIIISNEEDNDEEDYTSTYKINLKCTLDYIKEITNIAIIFKASQDFRDVDYAIGIISIPIKYFENSELLNNKDYINTIFKNIEIRDNEAKSKEKAAKIAELEAELAKLKGET